MPTIREAITKGVMSEPERKVFDVLIRHNDHIFSNSLEDLQELAVWCLRPADETPPMNGVSCNDDPVTINSKFTAHQLWDSGTQTRKNVSTYTLRTIAGALASLAKTDRIWRGSLSFTEGKKASHRIYYGAKGIEDKIQAELKAVDSRDRAATGFETLTPWDDEKSESNDI